MCPEGDIFSNKCRQGQMDKKLSPALLRTGMLILLLSFSTEGCMRHDARAQTTSPGQNSVVLRPVLSPQGFGVQDTGRVTNAAFPEGYYPFDIATSQQANWDIVAWSNPAGEPYLLPFTHAETYDNLNVPHDNWTSSSSPTAAQATAITIDHNLQSGVISQTISQSGIPDVKHCVTGSGDPLEYDFFIAANAKSLNPSYPSAYLSDEATPPPNPSLDQMSAITINGWVQLLSATSSVAPAQCAVNQSAMIYALVFNNTVNHQTLFYQLGLNWFCYAGTNPDVNIWCRTSVPQMNYFMTGQGGIWGIDDPLSNYVNQTTNRRYSLMQHRGLLELDINFLPRIAQLIQAGQHGLDPNLSHWQWGSFYYGQHTWGSAVLISKWMSANFSPAIVYSPAQ